MQEKGSSGALTQEMEMNTTTRCGKMQLKHKFTRCGHLPKSNLTKSKRGSIRVEKSFSLFRGTAPADFWRAIFNLTEFREVLSIYAALTLCGPNFWADVFWRWVIETGAKSWAFPNASGLPQKCPLSFCLIFGF